MRVLSLAERVLQGQVVLPRFQRDFVWTRRQILELLDSVSCGYPIGSLLLWSSVQNLASQRTIARLRVGGRRPDEKVDYLLDGQQRLTVICGALFWLPGDDPKSFWNIVYDLETRRFLHREDLEEPPAHQIPVRMLGDSFDFLERLALVGDRPELIQEGKRLYRSFADYVMPVVTLKDMPVAEIGKVFERTNSTGTRLTLVEFVRAATWSADFDLSDELDTIRTVLARKQYDQVDSIILLRAVSAAAGLGFTKTGLEQLRDLSTDELSTAVTETESAVRRAVDFLTTQIRTPTAGALPYPNQLAVLTEIFRQVPKPTAAQYRGIRGWFWRTLFGGYFDGWNENRMEADLQAVKRFADGRKRTIDVRTAPLNTSFWLRTQYRRGNATTKVLALMLNSADPLDLRTNARIGFDKALDGRNDMEFHHFFPKAYLLDQGVPSEEANCLANIVALTALSNNAVSARPPGVYLREELDFPDRTTEAGLRVRMESCLIDAAGYDAAMDNDYKRFRAGRADLLMSYALELSSGALPGQPLPVREELTEVEVPPSTESPIDTDTDD